MYNKLKRSHLIIKDLIRYNSCQSKFKCESTNT